MFDALAADAPLRDPDGGLPAADSLPVRLLAECLCRLDSVADDLRDHGWRDRESGDPRAAVELERRLRSEALDLAESLGMTPRSRARLGLDLARTEDAVQAAAEDWRREQGDRGSARADCGRTWAPSPRWSVGRWPTGSSPTSPSTRRSRACCGGGSSGSREP